MTRLLIVLLPLTLLGCRTEGEAPEPEIACVCGTEHADFHGCYCEPCLSG